MDNKVEHELIDEYAKHNYLYQYVNRDTLYIKIGNFTVSNYNFVKFSFWYMVLRFLSHSFELLYGW